MLSVNEISELVDLTQARIRQIIEHDKLRIVRKGDPEKGHIRLPNEAVRKILQHKNLSYSSITATIGQTKGGVGKSCLTFNVAYYLAERGAKVLVIDCDPDCTMTNYLIPDELDYKSFSTMLEVTMKDLPLSDVILHSKFEGIDFVASKSKVRKVANKLRDVNLATFFSGLLEPLLGNYDVILFDVPAGFNELGRAAYLASDLVVMPTIPDINAIEDCSLTMEDLRETKTLYANAKIPEFRVLRNQFQRQSVREKVATRRGAQIASKDADEKLRQEYSENLLDIIIPKSQDVNNCVNEGISFFDSSCSSPVFKDVKKSTADLATFLSPLQSSIE